MHYTIILKKILLTSFLFIVLLQSPVAFSLPVDWQGKFGAATTVINTYRNTKENDVTTSTTEDGSQIVPNANGEYKNAYFQDYILKLSPSIIINDSASLFAEATTGYMAGGIFGDSTEIKKETTQTMGNALYLQNTTNGKTSNLQLSKFYLSLYSDTATYIIGRHSFHWGLGAVFNEGINPWDRFSTSRDGLMAKMQVGNFHFSPYWAKISSGETLTNSDNTSSYGVVIKYDNLEQDLIFGLIYGKRSTQSFNTFYKKDGSNNIGRTEVKVVDLYFKKSIWDIEFQVEAPILSGDMSGIYSDDKNKYKASGVLTETSYSINDNWGVKLDAGYLSGEDGKGNDYHALFLNPNYQIANLMFRYNMHAVGDNNQNIYDSYMTNAKYAKLSGIFKTDTWNFKLSFIMAKAQETAKAGQQSYNHSTNKFFNARYNQKSDLGKEIDFDAEYKWNSNVTLTGKAGYFMVGDYYKFTNDTNERDAKLKNPYTLSANVIAQF